MPLLARRQGVAALANAFHDAAFIKAEAEQMNLWLAVSNRHRPAH